IIEIFLAQPDWKGVAQGFIPRMDASSVYIIIGIIGATVMPHNLYLHSSLVQSRAVSNTLTGKREACRFNFYDALIALNLAFFVNAAIYIMSAANFHARGIVVTEIAQAHEFLDQILGPRVAPVAFGVALLAAGQSSTITGTLSGQIVMEGFLNLRIRPWLRRLITRCVALVPAVLAILYFGNKASYQLLIWSQVILSLQLPFAIIPLLHFTSDRKKMGSLANPLWIKILGWLIAAVIIALNLKLVYDQAVGWNWVLIVLPAALLIGVLGYLILRPLLRPSKTWESGEETMSRAIAEHIAPALPFHHIGVALERTSTDAHTLSYAITLAQTYKARLTLFHVVDTPGTMVYGNESDSQHSQDDHAYLEQLAREIEERDLPVEFALGYGDIVSQLVHLSQECGLDLLLLGSHGHSGLSDMIHGETADLVRHTLTIPVMIVR
ncbi:TPA: iron/manganese transporter, partial [Candidatus Sumerlaeota bacterium]|nr:iron/manganese transporter [Candidatus Sumerlaeota bacterium]